MSDTPAKHTPWGLIVSIAVNGLLIGLLAGVLLAGGPGRRGGPPGPDGEGGGLDRGLHRAIMEAAPDAERQKMREQMGDAWRETEAERRTIREAQLTIAEAIAAEKFDRDAVLAAFESWREADLRIKQALQLAMVNGLDSLSPERRKQLAEDIKRHDARREKWRERVRERIEERRGERGFPPPPPPRD